MCREVWLYGGRNKTLLGDRGHVCFMFALCFAGRAATAVVRAVSRCRNCMYGKVHMYRHDRSGSRFPRVSFDP